MKSLVTTFAAAAALTLFASAAQADCTGAHKSVTASTSASKQIVAMSTSQSPVLQPAAEMPRAEAAAQTACSGAEKDCRAATK